MVGRSTAQDALRAATFAQPRGQRRRRRRQEPLGPRQRRPSARQPRQPRRRISGSDPNNGALDDSARRPGGGDARYVRDGRDDARGGSGDARYSRESGAATRAYSRDDVRGGGGQDTRYSRDGPRGGGDARNGSGDARYSRDDARGSSNGRDARFSKDDVRSGGPVCPPVQDVRYAADDVRSGGGVVAEADQVPGGRWGRNPGRGPRCMCDAPHAQGHIYWPVEHSLERGEAARRGRTSLLGTHGQLCAGFFHTDRSDEAENNVLCLHPSFSPRDFTSAAQLHGPADPDGPCSRKPNVVVIARLLDAAGTEVHVARFTNCYRGYTNSLHSEDFMIADGMLRKQARLGGGGDAARAVHDPAAVPPLERTRREQAGHRADVVHHQGDQNGSGRSLAAASISLDRKLSRIFRAHWYDDTVHKDGEASRSSAAARRWPATACVSCSRRRGRRSRCSIWTTGPSSCRRPTPPSPTGTSGTSTCRRIAREGWWEIEDPVARSDGFCAGWVKHDSAPYASRVAADVFFEEFLQRLRKSVERPVIAAPRAAPAPTARRRRSSCGSLSTTRPSAAPTARRSAAAARAAPGGRGRAGSRR